MRAHLPQFVEVSAVFILALYFYFASRGDERPRSHRVAEVLALAVGGFLGEEGCIRWYGAYEYSPGWTLCLDRVPVAVVVIWPAIILSGRAVAKLFVTHPRHLPWMTGLVVAFDGSLIEPLATNAGLWSWHMPGPFNVPLIGPLGYGFYAAATTWLFAPRDGKHALSRFALGAVLAPILAHVALLASWWGALRWIAAPWPPSRGLALGFCLGAVAAIAALRIRNMRRMPWFEAGPRFAAASLFGVILAATQDPWLYAYAVAFVPPYVLLLAPVTHLARASTQTA